MQDLFQIWFTLNFQLYYFTGPSKGKHLAYLLAFLTKASERSTSRLLVFWIALTCKQFNLNSLYRALTFYLRGWENVPKIGDDRTALSEKFHADAEDEISL
jgi:hypothetical protein